MMVEESGGEEGVDMLIITQQIINWDTIHKGWYNIKVLGHGDIYLICTVTQRLWGILQAAETTPICLHVPMLVEY